MPKVDKVKKRKSTNRKNMVLLSSFEPLDDFEFDEKSYNSKKKVSCICPKCGEQHIMAFHWIGRGTPRKYCQACKGGFYR
jgi:ribosomal protein S27AE